MWVAYSALMLAIAVALHSVISRLLPKGNRVIQFLACGACAGALLLVKLNAASELGRLGSTALLATYAFLCELYIFVFTLVMSRVPISLLFGGSGELLTPTVDMVGMRAERMVGTGLVARDGESLRLTHKGRWLLQVLAVARRVFYDAQLS